MIHVVTSSREKLVIGLHTLTCAVVGLPTLGGRLDAPTTLQAILAQLVLVGTLFLVTALRPYARPVDNWLSIVSLAGAHDGGFDMLVLQGWPAHLRRALGAPKRMVKSRVLLC